MKILTVALTGGNNHQRNYFEYYKMNAMKSLSVKLKISQAKHSPCCDNYDEP